MNMKSLLSRLKKPTVIIALVSQIVSMLLLFGIKIDQDLIMGASTIICAILVTLGVLSTPETTTLTCSSGNCGDQPHTIVDGKLACIGCGTEYSETPIVLPDAEAAAQALPDTESADPSATS